MHVFKRFLRYYKPYRTVFWLDMACAMLVSVIDLVFPQLLNYLTRNVFTRSPQEVLSLLAPLAFGLLAMYLARYGGRFYITYQGHVMGARMESDMRQDLFDQFQRLSFSYYDRNNTGEMMSKLVSDLFDIAEFAHISETHLRRIFSSHLNMSPLEYLNRVRIHAACEYLKKTDDSIALIQARCGFTVSSTFNRNFRRVTGVSPAEWRNRPENYERQILKFRIHSEKGW